MPQSFTGHGTSGSGRAPPGGWRSPSAPPRKPFGIWKGPSRPGGREGRSAPASSGRRAWMTTRPALRVRSGFPRHVQLPRIGKVRTKEPTEKLLKLLAEGKARILSAVLDINVKRLCQEREADRWFATRHNLSDRLCRVGEVERPDPEVRAGEPVGIDLGLEAFAVLSDGTRIEAPRPLKKALKLLRRRSRQLSRKQKGSKNYRKAALRLARLHRRIRNIRRDFLHKTTTELAKTKPVLVVEDLSVGGLGRGRLSRSVADSGWGMFRRMLEYKARWYGSWLIVAPQTFPSTRSCSACGALGSALPLGERTFVCPVCGLELDRDLNAALNLKLYGLAHLTGPTGSSPGQLDIICLTDYVELVETPLAAERAARPPSGLRVMGR